MAAIGVKGLVVLVGMASMHMMTTQTTQRTHTSPIKILRIGHNDIKLPMKSARLDLVERSALSATGGGTVEAVTPSVWVGKPVWMCTVSRGRTVWHVMVNQTTLRPISKIMVPHFSK
jgi:hypothetical protein